MARYTISGLSGAVWEGYPALAEAINEFILGDAGLPSAIWDARALSKNEAMATGKAGFIFANSK